MHPLVEQVKQLFLPDLERLASEMRQRFPALELNVLHYPVGPLTEYQGYDVGVECVFPQAAPHAADNVALTIGFCHLTSTPKVMAGVGWGSGYSEAEFREGCYTNADWPEATPEILEALRLDFPRLIRAFQAAVERGAPAS